MVSRFGLAFVLALLSDASAGATAPAAVRAYERGIREAEFARWPDAGAAFREALAIDAVENASPVARPSGMNFEPYLPHLGLAVAACESGELEAAAASSLESTRQGAAAKGGSRLPARWRQCAARRLGEAKSWAMDRFVEARRAWEAGARQSASAEEVASAARLAAFEGEGGADLSFEEWMARGGQAISMRAAFERSAGGAPASSATPGVANGDRPRAVPPAGAGAGDLWTRIDGLELASAQPDLPPAHPEWRAALAAARRELAAVGSRRETIALEELARAEGELALRIERLESELSASRLAAPLLAAAEALFAGEVERALAVLAGFDSPRARSRAQAHLLRAAVYLVRRAIEGDVSGELGRRALAERNAALADDPALRPDARYFSAAFVSFFESGTFAPEPVDLRDR
jgi:hypothetical protein